MNNFDIKNKPLIFAHFFNHFIEKYLSHKGINFTPFSTLSSLCMVKDKTNVILVLSGSFNPIHVCHEKMISCSIDYLEKNYNQSINCVSSFIIPRESINEKLSSKKSEIISFELRFKMCEKLDENKSRIYVWDESKIALWCYLEDCLKKEASSLGFKIEFIKIFGSDSFFLLDSKSFHSNIIWINRNGYEKRIPKYKVDDLENLSFIIRDFNFPTNSTQIREMIKNNQSLKGFMNENILKDSFIMKMLIETFQFEKINYFRSKIDELNRLKLEEIEKHRRKIENINDEIFDAQLSMNEISEYYNL